MYIDTTTGAFILTVTSWFVGSLSLLALTYAAYLNNSLSLASYKNLGYMQLISNFKFYVIQGLTREQQRNKGKVRIVSWLLLLSFFIIKILGSAYVTIMTYIFLKDFSTITPGTINYYSYANSSIIVINEMLMSGVNAAIVANMTLPFVRSPVKNYVCTLTGQCFNGTLSDDQPTPLSNMINSTLLDGRHDYRYCNDMSGAMVTPMVNILNTNVSLPNGRVTTFETTPYHLLYWGQCADSLQQEYLGQDQENDFNNVYGEVLSNLRSNSPYNVIGMSSSTLQSVDMLSSTQGDYIVSTEYGQTGFSGSNPNYRQQINAQGFYYGMWNGSALDPTITEALDNAMTLIVNGTVQIILLEQKTPTCSNYTSILNIENYYFVEYRKTCITRLMATGTKPGEWIRLSASYSSNITRWTSDLEMLEINKVIFQRYNDIGLASISELDAQSYIITNKPGYDITILIILCIMIAVPIAGLLFNGLTKMGYFDKDLLKLIVETTQSQDAVCASIHTGKTSKNPGVTLEVFEKEKHVNIVIGGKTLTTNWHQERSESISLTESTNQMLKECGS
jgi:hypothetical protein